MKIINDMIKLHFNYFFNVFSTCSSHAMIRRTHQIFLFSQNPFQLLSLRHIGYQLRDNIRDSYSLLNVTNDSSDDEVREAYLRLAKIYHPDSGTSSGDPRKFNQVCEAYMTIKVWTKTYATIYMFIIPLNDDIKVTPLNRKFNIVTNHLAVIFYK